MMDPKTQATTAVALLTPLVENTTAAQLDNPTPCTEWKVRSLINHVVGGGHMFAAGLRGEAPGGDPNADLLGTDHLAAYRNAIDSFSTALAATDNLEAPVTLPFGTLPAVAALQLAAGDLLVHCWDLAQATDQPFDPPVEFVEAAYGFFSQVVNDDMRAGGMFGPAIDAPADASALTRLLAHARQAA